GQGRHLDVEEQDVDGIGFQEGERRFRIGGRAGDLDAPGGLEQTRQPLHRQRLVVDDVDAQHHRGRGSGFVAEASEGRSTVTQVRPGALSIASAARVPNVISRRDFSNASPWPAAIADASKPGPSSSTPTCSRPFDLAARTTMEAPSRRTETAYFTLFSTRVCRARRGTIAPPGSPAVSTRYRRRSP